MEYGLQLYSVRDSAEKDMDKTLCEVAKLGYKFVEPAGFFGIPAEEFKAMIDHYGLRVSGTHTGFHELAKDCDEIIKYEKAIGCENIIIPWLDVSSADKVDAFIEEVNKIQPKVEAAGLNLLYHNHAIEFMKNDDGQVVHTELENRTKLGFEIDTYWAFVAGVDPLATLDRLGKRVSVIHLKDGDGKNAGRPLGEGVAPVKAVREKAISLGLPMVVESETLTPNGLDEARRCMEYLRTLD